MASVMTAGLGLLASSQSEAQPLSPAQAEAEAAVTPYVTPRVDVDVTYDATGPDGQHYRQRMRWNAAHWQQRIDIEATGLIMLTDYRAHRLSVVDTRTKSYSVSGSPDAQFAPPGTRAAGSWQRGAPDIVAGQGCTHWSTTDTDGQAGDFCYSDDGVLLSAAHDGTEIIRAVSYVPAAQGPDVFVEPSGFHETSPVRLDH
ncbi:hypothetical protein AA0535_2770 [Asaia krungthepensis NRIC 0535]|uniref:DUF4412 domain-containing protein n=2 Tax=Asaia krungthepensis TaxID=220990 RepID=A0ABQ0Q648_9PROT|nr:hypothetical protein AA0535_2770 [Asaia krungthepensis NRIC 0535]